MFVPQKKDIIFILLFICLYSLCYCFLIYIEKQERFHVLSNELYTNHHAVFINNGNYDWLESPLSKSSYRVFIEYNDTHRLLLEQSDDWSPPIITGRFFSKTDKSAKAVIGKEMTKYVKVTNEKKYITFQGEDFEVIGIMGASFASSTDYLILLYKPNPFPITSGTRIILDSDSKSTVTDITNTIIKMNPLVTLIESTQKGLSRTANIPFIYHLLILEFCFLLFLGVVGFIRYWYEKEKKLIYVLFLLGISKSRINRQLFLKIFINTIISGCITISLFLVFYPQSSIILSEMIWVAIFFLSCAWLFLSLFLRLDSKRGVVRK